MVIMWFPLHYVSCPNYYSHIFVILMYVELAHWNEMYILHKLFTSLNSKVFKKREDSEALDTLSNLIETVLEEIPTSDWSENIWICNLFFPWPLRISCDYVNQTSNKLKLYIIDSNYWLTWYTCSNSTPKLWLC